MTVALAAVALAVAAIESLKAAEALQVSAGLAQARETFLTVEALETIDALKSVQISTGLANA